ncbi:ABC transporter permease subunit [Clostridioides difficile]|uniref:ABC transporter permease subunit n=1 Tax=Clostridioides difficile TaxID=1496 RepID=UPI001FABB7CC|nr:ABC transporter permease subunit [Clostridioides difficile]MCJ0222489.1 ABC transporter permease subunit [Clostridioides difficile]MCJ0429382.1 ABC transporter permease subunit [Clostridioides difficile]MCJ0438421.1 ABC transporter permease subunit [Clostridioides difficile]MCU6150120.1 ABC transporter permease subunit [Clostridioides difficile]
MIHLMKLELKKVGLKRYFLFSILGIFLCMFFVFTGLNDKSTSIYDYDVTFRTISLVFCFYYIILFAVLNVAYIINEYTNKTILILFSYPLDRKKLILSKLLLITTLMISSMIVGYICCFTFVVVLDKYFNLVIGDFHISILSYWIPGAIKNIIVFCSLGIWTFVVGMIRKSIPVTLVSSIIFINLRQFILAGTNTTQDSLISVFIIVGITVIGIYYILNHKVTEID